MSQQTFSLNDAVKCHQSGNLDRALSMYQQLLTVAPDHPDIHHLMGKIFQAKGNASEAFASFKKAISLNPEEKTFYLSMSDCFLTFEKYTEAQQIADIVIQNFPADPEGYAQKGLAALRSRDYDNAIENFEAAIDRDSNQANYYLNLGAVYLEKEDLYNAVLYVKQALEMDPSLTAAHCNLGRIYTKTGEIASAIASYETALKINPNDYIANYNLASLYLRMNDHLKAKGAFEKLHALQPQDPYVKQMLAALSNELPQGENPLFAKALFDGHALTYDMDETARQNYRVPEMISEKIKLLFPEGLKDQNILDLGSGTGLIGEALRFMREDTTLTGIDISPKMVDVAKEKDLYTELFNKDVFAFLAESPNKTYDLILAADFLPYVNQLKSFFKSAKPFLKEGGKFIFSTETEPTHNVVLNISGRYAHRTEYVQKCLEETGWKINASEEIVLREAKEEKVQGVLWQVSLGK